MQLVLAGDFAVVREKYIEVIEHTRDMNIHARWIYGQHPPVKKPPAGKPTGGILPFILLSSIGYSD